MKFRKKPVIIEAIQFNYPASNELLEFMGDSAGAQRKERHLGSIGELEVKTLEDGNVLQVKHIATEGDWIIKGVHGEFYPCKPDIFSKTYEKIK